MISSKIKLFWVVIKKFVRCNMCTKDIHEPDECKKCIVYKKYRKARLSCVLK